jgi:hypothetical protein
MFRPPSRVSLHHSVAYVLLLPVAEPMIAKFVDVAIEKKSATLSPPPESLI